MKSAPLLENKELINRDSDPLGLMRKEEAVSKVKALALRVLADRLEHGEEIPELRGRATQG